MKTRDFIQNVLGKEIKQMTTDAQGNTNHAYIGFSLICQSIEVLGACFDEYDWENRYLSELRFRLAISKLFNNKYQKYNNKKTKIDLYNNLRCPMVHQMRPGNYIGLSEEKHKFKKKPPLVHLSVCNNKLILIYEDFLKDFINACNKIVKMIDSGELKTKKVLGHNISVPNDSR